MVKSNQTFMKFKKKKVFRSIIKILFVLIIFELNLQLLVFTNKISLNEFNKYSREEYKYKILVLGESISAGQYISWPAQLEKILNHKQKDVKFIVYNEAVGGVNTLYIVSKLESQVKKYNPDFIISMMGVHDPQNLYNYLDSSEIEQSEESKKIISNKGYTSKDHTNPDDFFVKIKHMITSISASDEDLCKRYIEFGDFYFYEKTEISKAKQMYEKALKTCRHKAPAYVTIGFLYFLEGNHDKAEKMYYKSIEDDPYHVQAYLELGDMYNAKYDFNKSIDTYTNALKLRPNNTQLMLGLAITYYKNEQFALAKNTLLKLTNITQNNDHAFELLGEISVKEKEFSQGTVFFEKVSDINNNKGIILSSQMYLAKINNSISELIVDGLTIKFNKSEGKKRRFSATKNHYLYVYDLSKKNNITYIAVQYPTLSIEPIKDFFSEEDQKNIIFISNKENFQEALKNDSYYALFIDNCGLNRYKGSISLGNREGSIFYGKYGHLTVKGSRLIAENVANVILENFNMTTN